jgi:hypothetical protein
MDEATYLAARAGGAALDSGVRFPSKFSIIADGFAPYQVLNFRSLANVTDYHGKLHPLKDVASMNNESLASCLLLGL